MAELLVNNIARRSPLTSELSCVLELCPRVGARSSSSRSTSRTRGGLWTVLSVSVTPRRSPSPSESETASLTPSRSSRTPCVPAAAHAGRRRAPTTHSHELARRSPRHSARVSCHARLRTAPVSGLGGAGGRMADGRDTAHDTRDRESITRPLPPVKSVSRRPAQPVRSDPARLRPLRGSALRHTSDRSRAHSHAFSLRCPPTATRTATAG